MRRWAFVFALAAALSSAYDLARIPVQVSDSLGIILNLQSISSPAEAFRQALVLDVGYLRPLRPAQIKVVLDASQGHYTLAFRAVHILMMTAAVLLFVRALRVRSSLDLAAAMFAIAVFIGLHTFFAMVREAHPINAFLQMVVLALATLNLAQGSPSWIKDAAASLLFVAGALVVESGLLVWVVAAAAGICGMRGLSRRGIVVMTALLAGYLAIRFLFLDKGLPGLDARPSGFLLDRLEPEALQAKFADQFVIFYAYNVVSSVSSVLLSEPRAGVWVAVRDFLGGGLTPGTIVNVVSSTLTTAFIVVAAVRRWRDSRLSARGFHAARAGLSDADRLLFVSGAVLAANAALSFAYTKDDILSVAGAFYGLAAYAAVRELLAWGREARNPIRVTLLTAALCAASTGWALRVVGLHHGLRATAFVTRNDWASLPSSLSEVDPEKRAIVERLRRDALERRVVPPYFVARWQQRWFDE